MTSTPVAGVRRSSIESFAAVVGLVAFSGVALNAAHINAAEIGAPTSDWLLTAIKAVAACYALWGACFALRRQRWGIAGWLLIALHVAALVSVGWSDAPRLSFFRALQLIGTTLFALTIAVRFDRSEQVRLLAVACLTVIAMIVVAVLVIPETAIMSGEFEGAWRGVFGHKNQLGKFAVMSAAVFACLDRREPSSRWLRPLGLGAAVLLVLASTSKTALVSLLALFFAFPAIRYLRRQRSLLPHAIALASVSACIMAILWHNAEAIAEMLGRDLTLSGRTALWFAVIAFCIQRPWLGYGYAAFWRGMEGDSAYVSMALHWDVPHAHNGWLDIWLDMGLMGVALFSLFFIVCVRRAFTAASENAGGAELWPLIAVVVAFIANLTESSLLRPNTLTWVILVLASMPALGAETVQAEESVPALTPALQDG